MGYYCTVPQCTSMAGKTKNVKFHKFPADEVMSQKWNDILKRGKAVTPYSKVCSLHFTQADYNVTAMGQWKTLSKNAVPSQNLPKLNPDGSVMIIRKCRTTKSSKKRDCSQSPIISLSHEKWYQNKIVPESKAVSAMSLSNSSQIDSIFYLKEKEKWCAEEAQLTNSRTVPGGSILAFHLQSKPKEKPKKQDAMMQTDPVTEDESTTDDKQIYDYKKDYIPQTNEEYNKEAEKYALERKSHFEKSIDKEKSYNKSLYKASQDLYLQDSVGVLRNQQQNLSLLQEQHRLNENQNFFNESNIKQEFKNEEDTFDSSSMYNNNERLMMEQIQLNVKQEPDLTNNNGCQLIQTQTSPYYSTASGQNVAVEYVGPMTGAGGSRPGPELLIAKQNALAAHTQLWQNTMKRPFFYTENNQYDSPPAIQRFETVDDEAVEEGPNHGEVDYSGDQEDTDNLPPDGVPREVLEEEGEFEIEQER
ncbi:uncharacterized protein LOC126974760 isoform X2 [Leptidea sinapis]|uniref:uncharacterized protein LOC126974760 isoform X2 n=1 Tax=Leptidea sinapis TaxID=189913 RepID=UPI0021C43CBC|nr:uncharacterized protein LOC126974760 isoform X2 [Leptidea sinapis]